MRPLQAKGSTSDIDGSILAFPPARSSFSDGMDSGRPLAGSLSERGFGTQTTRFLGDLGTPRSAPGRWRAAGSGQATQLQAFLQHAMHEPLPLLDAACRPRRPSAGYPNEWVKAGNTASVSGLVQDRLLSTRPAVDLLKAADIRSTWPRRVPEGRPWMGAGGHGCVPRTVRHNRRACGREETETSKRLPSHESTSTNVRLRLSFNRHHTLDHIYPTHLVVT